MAAPIVALGLSFTHARTSSLTAGRTSAPSGMAVDSDAGAREMGGSVEMGTGVLGHLELTGVVAVGVVVVDRGRCKRARAGPERGAGPEWLCQVDETRRREQGGETVHALRLTILRRAVGVGLGSCSDEALVEHRIRHLHETRDVGAVDVIAGCAVFLGSLPALAVDRDHDRLQMGIDLLA